MSNFKESFPNDYRNLVMSLNSRDKSKRYNNRINNKKYVSIYAFDNDGKVELLIGFTNEAVINPVEPEFISKAYRCVAGNYDLITTSDPISNFKETIIIPATEFQPIEVEKISWQSLIDSPKIEEGDFSILSKSFLEYFSLDSNEYFDENNKFDFNNYFYNEQNKPEELELRTVWIDVDSNEKYGDIQTLIFWKTKFIGWTTQSGKWLDSLTTSTVDVEGWKDLMQTIYNNTGFVRENFLKGVTVYDMNNVEVDDVAFVPNISIKNYD